MQQAIDAHRAACLLACVYRLALRNVCRGLAIDVTSSVVRMIVAEIRADQHQRLFVSPYSIEDCCNVLRFGSAGGQRQQLEVAQQHLQKWQLHFQRMFLCVRCIRRHDLATGNEHGASFVIDADFSQRCRERIGPRRGDTLQINPMARPQEHHSANGATPRQNAGIGGCRDAAGIDVAGVWNDECFRRRLRCVVRRVLHELMDRRTQQRGIGGIEHSCHGGGAHACLFRVGAHDRYIRPLRRREKRGQPHERHPSDTILAPTR